VNVAEMADDEKYKIPLFDGTNYSNWKFRMQVLLEEHDLIDFINKPLDILTGDLSAETAETQAITLQKKDRKCKSFITQRIADSHLKYVKEKATAFRYGKLFRKVSSGKV